MFQHVSPQQSKHKHCWSLDFACVALTLTALIASLLVFPHTSRAATSPGYLTNSAELSQRKQLAAQKVEPYKSAVSDVVSFAKSQLTALPTPQATLDITDTASTFVDDSATAYGLALAYGVTGDIRYAQQSRTFIMAWVTTLKKTLNTCPTSGACQTSLIMSRVAPGFVFAADLIAPSGVFSPNDDLAFKAWLRTVILPTASTKTNNWGDAGTFMRVAITVYLGDKDGFDSAIAKWKSQVDMTAADGSIPEETRRGIYGINYTQEAIDYRIGVAKIAEWQGLDLWSYGRFKQSIDYVVPYVLDPSTWPWAVGASTNVHPVWEIAYQKWQDPDYVPIILKRRPYGNNGNSALRWVTLTNGIPFPTGIPIATSTNTPSTTSVATSTNTPSPSETAMPSETATPSDTATPSATATPSDTAISNPIPTASDEPNSSIVATPSNTPTASPSDTPTATASATASPSSTATSSATASPTGTSIPSSTATPTIKATSSATATRTGTATRTSTASRAATVTRTPTRGSVTRTPTNSRTPTRSPTRTPTRHA